MHATPAARTAAYNNDGGPSFTLLQTGVSPNARDTHGNTAAHQLASTLATAKAKNSAELVASATRCMQVLTAGGARLKVANNDGITVAKLLEDAGATAAIEAATQGEAQALTREAPAIAKSKLGGRESQSQN